MAKVGINGFGRIGRTFLKVALEKRLEVLAINQPRRKPDYMAYLLKHDSVHGRFPCDVCADDKHLIVNGKKIRLFGEADVNKVKWKDAGVEYVVEASGHYTKMDEAKKILDGGAKKVIVSAPSKDLPMYVPGVNACCYKASETMVSMASCTTNCVAPLAKVIHGKFGIVEALMTTVHAVTLSQAILDGAQDSNWRLGRGGLNNIIPTSTGAAAAVAKVIPELQGKITGMAFRVPVANASVVDLTVKLCKEADYEKIKCEIRQAAENEMRGVMCFTEEDIVSTDVIGSGCSCIFDAKAGVALNGTFVKLIAWYDNEYGYSSRLVDLVNIIYKADCAAACEAKKKEETCGGGDKGGASKPPDAAAAAAQKKNPEPPKTKTESGKKAEFPLNQAPPVKPVPSKIPPPDPKSKK